MSRMVIESLGVYLPPRRATTDEVVRGCRTRITFPLERLTGIRARRVAGDAEYSIDLATKAVEDCLARSKYRPADYGLVICCNISRYDGPDFRVSFEPSSAMRLKKRFGFDHAMVFDVANACPGMFTGMRIVQAFLEAGTIRCGLVVSGEFITHLTTTAQQEIEGPMDPRMACLTLGDAGAAVSLESSTSDGEAGFHELELYTSGRYSAYCVAKATDQPHGGAIMLTDAIRLSAVTIRESVAHALEVQRLGGWPADAFHHLIMHQTSRTTLTDAMREINRALKLRVCHEGNTIFNMAERGNTATTSQMVALYEHVLNHRIRSGDRLVFGISGSGLTIGTAFYALDDLPDRLRRGPTEGAVPVRRPAGRGAALRLRTTPRARIASVGALPDGPAPERDVVALGTRAVERCLARSARDRRDVALLLYSGVYRQDYICEPAIGAMIAGAAGINDAPDSPGHGRTLAFDVLDGAVGTLDACCVASQMLSRRAGSSALIVAAEIENNAGVAGAGRRGLVETGSALMLDRSGDGRVGFGAFAFQSFPEYLDAFAAHTVHEGGRTRMHFDRDPALETYFLACIPDAVRELLEFEGLHLDRIKVILPPLISANFVTALGKRLGVARDKLVDLPVDGRDYASSSLAYAWQRVHEERRAGPGDVGLIIAVGSGIQVGCAAYYF